MASRRLLAVAALALPVVAPWTFGPSVSAVQMMLALMAASLLLLYPGPGQVAPKLLGAVICVGALVVVATIPDMGEMSRASAAFALMVACLLVGARIARRDGAEQAQIVMVTWLLIGLLQAAIGLIQYAGLAAESRWWMSASPQGVAYGNLRQRNQFATIINIAFLCLVFYACSARTRAWTARTWVRFCVMLGAVLLGTANALSGSRTGLLGSLLVLAITILWSLHKYPDVRRLTSLFAAAYASTSVFVLGGPFNRAGTSALARFMEERGCHSRLVLWENVIELIKQRPIGGWGWEGLSAAHFSTLYEGVRFCEILDNAHNLPMQIAVSLGLPLLVGICLAAIWAIRISRPWAESDPQRQLHWGVLALMLLHSMLEYPLWYGPFLMITSLSIGALGARRPAQTPLPEAAARRGITGWIAAVLLMAVLYAAWDYWRVSQIYLPREARAANYREDTLAKISSSWLFADQVRFAQLTITPLTPANAAVMHELAERTLHFSPEPAVIEKYIGSARLLGRDADAAWAESRYAAAFPAEHARWKNALSAAR